MKLDEYTLDEWERYLATQTHLERHDDYAIASLVMRRWMWLNYLRQLAERTRIPRRKVS